MLLGQTDPVGEAWAVRWVPFSLDQTKVPEGGADVWSDPEKAGARMAVEVGIAVRDRWPDAFLAVHRDLFAARHDEGLDLRDHDVVAAVLAGRGLDADEVFEEVLGGRPTETFRAEHLAAVEEHQVFGVPTLIVDGRAAFLRLLDRPGDDVVLARRTIQRALHLLEWPALNELKHTTVPR